MHAGAANGGWGPKIPAEPLMIESVQAPTREEAARRAIALALRDLAARIERGLIAPQALRISFTIEEQQEP